MRFPTIQLHDFNRRFEELPENIRDLLSFIVPALIIILLFGLLASLLNTSIWFDTFQPYEEEKVIADLYITNPVKTDDDVSFTLFYFPRAGNKSAFWSLFHLSIGSKNEPIKATLNGDKVYLNAAFIDWKGSLGVGSEEIFKIKDISTDYYDLSVQNIHGSDVVDLASDTITDKLTKNPEKYSGFLDNAYSASASINVPDTDEAYVVVTRNGKIEIESK